MNKFTSALAALLPDLESRGPVYLYALAERDDVNRWDVILSAAWSDDDYAAAVRIVADAVRARIDPSEITMLSRVVILPSDSPGIVDMPRSLEAVLPGDEHLVSVPLQEADTRRMYVFKAMRPPHQTRLEATLPTAASHD